MKTIPQPRPHFIIGNLLDLDRTDTIQSLMRLASEYGPIFRLQVFGTGMVIVSSQALVNELCDETRFDKRIHLPLGYLRENGGDALATAYTQEPNWGRAHRILQPGFGITALRSMFAPMWDIAEQLLLKWERLGEQARIDVASDTVRLALDTIALCAFDYRFNNFYGDVAHPFAAAVQRQFADANERMRRPPVMARLMVAAPGSGPRTDA